MRPDKKGNKKRDERRNGPKTGPQKPTAGPQKPTAGPQKPAGAAQNPVEESAVVQGPRVLEPVAAPPPEGARYQRREIRSNWHRYDEEPGAAGPLPPDQDFLRGDTFTELLAASTGGAGHFQLRCERSWLEAGDGTSVLLTLDVPRTATAVDRLPLPRRLHIDTQHFTQEQLEQFALEADTSAASATASASTLAALVGPDTSAASATASAITLAALVGPAAPRPPAATTASHQGTSQLSHAAAGSAEKTGTEPACVPLAPSPPPSAGVTAVAAVTCPGDVSSRVTAAAAAEPAPALLLQDDWLDSVLSDED